MTGLLLDGIAEAEFGACRRLLLDQKADDIMTPHLTGYTADGPVFIIAAPWHNQQEKLLAIAFCRRKLREHHCTAYSMASEAWIANYARGEWDSGADLPSQRANRIEALIVYAEDSAGIVSRAWRIERGADGCIRELEPRPQDFAPNSLVFGGLLATEQ